METVIKEYNKQFRGRRYELIISVPVHESPEAVVDMVNNFNNAFVGMTFVILLHVNSFMIQNSCDFYHLPNVIVKPYAKNLKKWGTDLPIAYIGNHEYVTRELNITYDMCMLQASNVLYYRRYMRTDFDREVKNMSKSMVGQRTEFVGESIKRDMESYIDLMNLVKERGWYMEKSWQEGNIVPFVVMEQLTKDKWVLEAKTDECCLAMGEWVFSTFKTGMGFCREEPRNHSTTYINLDPDAETIVGFRRAMQNDTTPEKHFAYKRVARRNNDPLRAYINNLLFKTR